ncbi:MAG TPA: sulfatase-like hydrolase/transferase [Sedimentisphaerales bacterium]|nr:sulfatase-like hydrolase/transferase [Sedimentisphaerales bacterium]HRS11042.1 sulfatase-like hydrolase/transferase [Sedimentisphaerales bacterium]HRV49700.1 sulfatase-like hydrolase/transferase [Sedimentisphaerales bacterium]
MKRRAFLKGLVASLSASGGPGSRASRRCDASEVKRLDTSGMNLLLIHVEGLAAGAVGCYGNPVVKTPNLDRFASRALRFTRCYCQSSTSRLSQTSLLTGLRPDMSEISTTHRPGAGTPPAATPRLPDLLRQYGFHTVHLDNSDAASCDKAREGCCREELPCDDEREPDEQRGRLAVDNLVRITREGAPFFLCIGFSEPHVPRGALKTYLHLYDADNIAVPHAFACQNRDIPGVAQRFGRYGGVSGDDAAGLTTDQAAREAILTYYAGVSFVDTQIGLVLDALDATGHSHDTIVVILSNYGFHLGEYGLWGPSTLFEQVTRVPLLVRIPAVTIRQAVCEEIVELVDLLPTVCDLLTVPAPDRLEGKSFVPLLFDPAQPWKRAAFTVCQTAGYTGRSVRTKRWRYTDWQSWATPQRRFELYDLDSDPWEQTNLALNPDYRNERTILANLLQRGWQAAQ